VITGRRADRLSAAVRATLRSLAGSGLDDLDDAAFFRDVATRVAGAVHARKATVSVLTGDKLRTLGSFGFPAERPTVEVTIDRGAKGIVERVLFEDLVFAGNLRDERNLQRYRDTIEALDVHDAIAVGWRSAGAVLGTLSAFDSQRPGGFDADDVLVLELAAEVSGFVFRERVTRARQEALLALSDQLSRLPDFDSMARATAAAVSTVLPGIECGVVEVPRGRPDVMRTIAPPAGVEETIPEENPTSGTGAGRVLESGEPLETDELERYSVHGAALVSAGFRRVRVLPITAGHRLPDGRPSLGTIAYLSRSPEPFSTEDRRFMDEIARRLGMLAHRAELMRHEAEESAGLRAALDAAIDIGSSLEPPAVIARLLERATEVLAADRATLASIDGDDLVIRGSYAADGSAFDIGSRFKYRTSPRFMRLIETRHPVMETYSLDEVEAGARNAMQGIQQSITVPITEAGQVVASVTVSRRTDRPFTASEARTLEVVSAAAGIALENARLFQDARQASLAKTEFLNMAGHELRTPLAVIRGYLSLIATGAYGAPPEGWASVLSLLEDKSAELSTMVESILVAARLQSGRVQVSRDEVDLDAVVRQAVSRAGAAAALTGGAVVGRYASMPVHVLGDATQIGVIVDNLLANAVKYSPPPAAVTATLESHGGFAEVRIADCGRGIPSDQHARIFEEFVRVDDKDMGLTSGTGLGLYIARQLAERYGGSLELEWSEPGRGSSFLLRLPAIAS